MKEYSTAALPQRRGSSRFPAPVEILDAAHAHKLDTLAEAVEIVRPELGARDRSTAVRTALRAWAATRDDRDLGCFIATISNSADEVSVAAASRFVAAALKKERS